MSVRIEYIEPIFVSKIKKNINKQTNKENRKERGEIASISSIWEEMKIEAI